MTTAKPPARYSAMESARSGDFATPELHHPSGRDPAAGRLVFENVLLADPQAFARRTPVRTRDQARTTALAAPASTGDASADRETFDGPAGRATFRGRGAESAVPPMRRTEVAQASGN